jgi:hypothetical protein
LYSLVYVKRKVSPTGKSDSWPFISTELLHLDEQAGRELKASSLNAEISSGKTSNGTPQDSPDFLASCRRIHLTLYPLMVLAGQLIVSDGVRNIPVCYKRGTLSHYWKAPL